MILLDPLLREQMAAEYVLGTLRGPARDRFERWLHQDGNLRGLVNLWEELLAGFNASIEPVAPPERLWQLLEQRLGFVEAAPTPAGPGAIHSGLRWRRGAAWAFGIVALLVAAVVFRPDAPESAFMPDLQVVLQNKQAQPVWQVQADTASNTLIISAVRPIQLPSDRDLELWLVPKSGEPPISLGLMPTQLAYRQVLKSTTPLTEGAALAVSLEPKGGSPTGSATGPILYVQPYETPS